MAKLHASQSARQRSGTDESWKREVAIGALEPTPIDAVINENSKE